MKKWGLLLLFWIFPVMAQSFLPGTEDVPLMEGLTQVEETASFDTPSERMVLINAQTRRSAKEIFRFYRQTLLNLGWQTKDGRLFQRGSDSLLIETTKENNHQIVQFKLSQTNL